MRIIIAFVLNVIICLIYLLSICLINNVAPTAHPNVAYGLTMIVWTCILCLIQILLLFFLLLFRKKNLCFIIPLIIPCLYELNILDAFPKRSFAWLLILLIYYFCYYMLLIKYIISNKL